MIRRATNLGLFAALAFTACAPVQPHYGPPGAGTRVRPDGSMAATAAMPQEWPSTPPPVQAQVAPPPGVRGRSAGAAQAPALSGSDGPAATAPVVRGGTASQPRMQADDASTAFRFVFQIGDELGVAVWKEKDLDIVQRVQRDGTISPMLLGTVMVAGRSIDEVRLDLEQRYTEYLREPKVSVRVVNVFSERAYVLGEVNEPAAVALVGPTSLLQVLAQAGGMDQENADQKRVRIVRTGADGRASLITANVAAILMGQQPAPSILPGDVIYVAPSGLADWSRGMTQALGPLTSVISSAGSIITSLAAIKALDN